MLYFRDEIHFLVELFECWDKISFLGVLFASLTIETGLAYFAAFIPEKKILLCVILFPTRRGFIFEYFLQYFLLLFSTFCALLGFISEKKILLCVILFPPHCRSWLYKGRLRRPTYFAKKHCSKKFHQNRETSWKMLIHSLLTHDAFPDWMTWMTNITSFLPVLVHHEEEPKRNMQK